MQVPDASCRLFSRGLPYTSAFLCFDGQPAEVLGDFDNKIDRVYAFVEAGREGAIITAGWYDQRVRPENEGFVVSLRIDGVFINAVTFQPGDKVFSLPKDDPKRVALFQGQLADDNHLNLVRLAPITYSSDDAQYTHSQADIDKAGLVQIQYHRISNLRYAQPVYPVGLEGVVLEEKPEFEKNLPSNQPTHQAYTAEAIEQPGRRWFAFDYIDQPETPFYTFEWRIKSRQKLQEWTYLPSAYTPEGSPELSANTPSTNVGAGKRPGLAPSSFAGPPPPLPNDYRNAHEASPTPSTVSRRSKDELAAQIADGKAKQAQLEREIEELSSLAEDDEEGEREVEDEDEGMVEVQDVPQARRSTTLVQDGFEGRAPEALGEMVLDSDDDEEEG